MTNNKWQIKHVKIVVCRILLLLFILFWMLMIFGFSSADGEASQSTSDVITQKIVEYIYNDYKDREPNEQQEIWNQVSFIVRKTGHFGEYGILAVLISCFLITFQGVRANIRKVFWGMSVCVLYAVSDEMHQGFVAGRSPKIMDVCIDSAGAFCGIVFVIIVWFLFEKLQTKIRNT